MAREASGNVQRLITASSSSRPASGATTMTPPPTNRAKITEIGSSSATSRVAPTRPLATSAASTVSTAPPATASGLTSPKINSPVRDPTEDASSTPSLLSVEVQRPTNASAFKDLLEKQELLDLDFETTAPSQAHISAALADLIDLDFSIGMTPDTSAALIDFSESDPISSSISIPSSTNSDSLNDAMNSIHGSTGLLWELEGFFGGNQNEITGRPVVGAEVSKGQDDTQDLLSFEDLHITNFINHDFYSDASDSEHYSDSEDNDDNDDNDDDNDDDDSDDSDGTTGAKDDLWRTIGENRIRLDMATLENIRIDLENAGVTWDELTRVKL
ncbi:hypothetical protein BGZ58_007516 [Dissophora ornata]|nr:hypothetical protein BGZ58_007516 [Dissophora ornata]